MNTDRPVSKLLKNQIEHLQSGFRFLPLKQTNIYINAIKTEGRRLHPPGDAGNSWCARSGTKGSASAGRSGVKAEVARSPTAPLLNNARLEKRPLPSSKADKGKDQHEAQRAKRTRRAGPYL
jgi:hypothetical protein